MVENLFLTEHRRDVLNGESDLSGQSLANEKYRIRKRARIALQELIKVAEGGEISNDTVFDSGDLSRLVAAVLSGDEPITPRWNFDGTESEYRDRYGHQMDTCFRLSHAVDGYRDTLLERRSPEERYGDPPTDVDLTEEAEE